MAPFRRGKSAAGRVYPATRGGFGGSKDGGRQGHRGAIKKSTTTRNKFQTSRLDDTVNDPGKESDVVSEEAVSREGLEDLSSQEESSESDADVENSYNVLLQTLIPTSSRGEPKRKRRKLEPVDESDPVRTPSLSDSGDLDAVEGEELESHGESDDEDQSDTDGSPERNDYFTRHFNDTNQADVSPRIQAMDDKHWVTENSGTGSHWRSTLRRPVGFPATKLNGEKGALGLKNFKLKSKFEKGAEQLFSKADGLMKQLASSIFSYQDVLFAARSLDNADAVRSLAALHALNHIHRTRDKVLRNNVKLARSTTDEDLEARDQGFTRPKVLMLLPTRQSCVKMVNTMTTLCAPEQQENKKRFQESYANTEENLAVDKPEDFKELFGGNDDDMFRLGLKFTRKTMKFFSQFYSSDMVLASPLGLRTALEGDGKKKQDYDFLSSIEIIVIDQGEALAMQNWDHIEYILEHLNLQPKEAHGCDFGRVRNWYLDGHAKYYRQTLLFSAFNFPSLNKIYTQQMLNLAGKIKLSKVYEGAIINSGSSVQQTFSRFDFSEPASEPDNRFSYFTTGMLSSLIKGSSNNQSRQQGVLVFIPLYADFVRIRNYLASSTSTQHVSFGSVSEYTSAREAASARSHFLTGRHSILLYTERAHHFRRYRLKGVRKVILYGLPENPVFYQEIVIEYLGSSIAEGRIEPRLAGARCLFSKLDLLKLERIVGTQRYRTLLSDKGDTFEFT
ncbi:MAG: hypothetical protein LQ350_002982 [Teloschistes chrysophthalmus]|nr:MAG: hypothetical protein LQ350_002982 [Niorma chrysophthalma]